MEGAIPWPTVNLCPRAPAFLSMLAELGSAEGMDEIVREVNTNSMEEAVARRRAISLRLVEESKLRTCFGNATDIERKEECGLARILQAMLMTMSQGRSETICNSYIFSLMSGGHQHPSGPPDLDSFIEFVVTEEGGGIELQYDRVDEDVANKLYYLARLYTIFFPLHERGTDEAVTALPLRKIEELQLPWMLTLQQEGGEEPGRAIAEFLYEAGWGALSVQASAMVSQGLEEFLNPGGKLTIDVKMALDMLEYNEGGVFMGNYQPYRYSGFVKPSVCAEELAGLPLANATGSLCDWNPEEGDLPVSCERYCRELARLREREEVAVRVLDRAAIPYPDSPLAGLPYCSYGQEEAVGIERCWRRQVTEWGLCYSSFTGGTCHKDSFCTIVVSFSKAFCHCTVRVHR